MPEVVRALAAPLANVDKITIVSTGNGTSAGMHKITGDITQMAAQIPALFETLSGMQMSELFAKVRLIGDKVAEAGRSRRRAAAQYAVANRSKTMALLERVATLVRANLNDLIDKAEDPEKMIKQVILDMQNQLLQVKTQVAISIADQHVLEKKLAGERGERAAVACAAPRWPWTSSDDALARAALERAMTLPVR